MDLSCSTSHLHTVCDHIFGILTELLLKEKPDNPLDLLIETLKPPHIIVRTTFSFAQTVDDVSFVEYLLRFLTTPVLPSSLCLVGPPGCGKSALLPWMSYAALMCGHSFVSVNPTTPGARTLNVDAVCGRKLRRPCLVVVDHWEPPPTLLGDTEGIKVVYLLRQGYLVCRDSVSAVVNCAPYMGIDTSISTFQIRRNFSLCVSTGSIEATVYHLSRGLISEAFHKNASRMDLEVRVAEYLLTADMKRFASQSWSVAPFPAIVQALARGITTQQFRMLVHYFNTKTPPPCVLATNIHAVASAALSMNRADVVGPIRGNMLSPPFEINGVDFRNIFVDESLNSPCRDRCVYNTLEREPPQVPCSSACMPIITCGIHPKGGITVIGRARMEYWKSNLVLPTEAAGTAFVCTRGKIVDGTFIKDVGKAKVALLMSNDDVLVMDVDHNKGFVMQYLLEQSIDAMHISMTMHVVCVASDEQLELLAFDGDSTEIDFSCTSFCLIDSPVGTGDESWACVGDENGTFFAYNAVTAKPIYEVEISEGHDITCIVGYTQSLIMRERRASVSVSTRVMVGAEDGYLCMISLHDGEVVESFSGHKNAVIDVAITEHVIASLDSIGLVHLWTNGVHDVRSEIACSRSVPALKCVALSNDGGYLLMGRLMGLPILCPLEEISVDCASTHLSSITAVAFSSDTTQCATADSDGLIIVWRLDAAYNKTTSFRDHMPHAVHCLSFCPNSSQIVSSDLDHALLQWDTLSRVKRVLSRVGGCVAKHFQSDSWLVYGVKNRGVKVVSPKNERFDVTNYFPRCIGVDDASGRIAISPDLEDDEVNEVLVFHRTSQTGEPLMRLKGHEDSVSDIVFVHDGSLIVTASYDLSVAIWDGANGSMLHQLDRTHFVQRVFWSKASQCLLVLQERDPEGVYLGVYSIPTKESEPKLLSDMKAEADVKAMACHRDGNFILAGDANAELTMRCYSPEARQNGEAAVFAATMSLRPLY